MLTPEQRRTLITIARESISAVLAGRAYEFDDSRFDETLRRPAGCFVTLKTHGDDLRGCIGTIQPVHPLARAVASSAVSAAFRDPRFYPLTRAELPEIELEISVMGPIVPAKPEEIVPGRDGLIITRGRNAGLLLPQVATEYGWDRETFLEHTCVKAGLPRDAWRDPATKLERFEAEVFGEVAR